MNIRGFRHLLHSTLPLPSHPHSSRPLPTNLIQPPLLSLAFKAITALFLTFLSSIINPEHAPMLQLNRTAYTPTGSGFSLSLLKLFRLKFSFWHLPMETRTWAGINSSVNLFQKLFRMSLNTTKESCLNAHDTCYGRTQPPWIKRMLLLAAPVCMPFTVHWSSAFPHGVSTPHTPLSLLFPVTLPTSVSFSYWGMERWSNLSSYKVCKKQRRDL